ncbi:hypothetical protein SCO01_05490 [Staphylococcus cohnii subsp. cohnii]|nr:hypothetical protein SCO01_05490 [Staphylococcus cohnii subsp. cohnii]
MLFSLKIVSTISFTCRGISFLEIRVEVSIGNVNSSHVVIFINKALRYFNSAYKIIRKSLIF